MMTYDEEDESGSTVNRTEAAFSLVPRVIGKGYDTIVKENGTHEPNVPLSDAETIIQKVLLVFTLWSEPVLQR